MRRDGWKDFLLIMAVLLILFSFAYWGLWRMSNVPN